MRLNRLVLRNFRNYVDVEVDFTEQVNFIIGANAQGKTSLLEAIYFLSTAKSHRTYPDDELIRHNQAWFYLKGIVSAAERGSLMTLEASNTLHGRKRFKLNGNLQPKLSQWIGQFNVVFFSPESLSLVKGVPADRRRFVDLFNSQVNSTYLTHLQNYQFSLRQRNELLKQIQQKLASAGLLESWDELIVADGAAIMRGRAEALAKLNRLAKAKHADLTGHNEALDLRYQPAVEGVETISESEAKALFRERLNGSRTQDIARGTTSFGPHRDDFKLMLEAYSDGGVQYQEARAFGSQGQQRTIALALKLSELELIRAETLKTPLVLLDDVFSELDENRSMHLFGLLQGIKAQTFITSTRQEDWTPEFGDCQVLTVKDGQVLG